MKNPIAPAILDLVRDDPARWQVEYELTWLVNFNKPDLVIVDAAQLARHTAQRLAARTAGEKYLVETLRLVLEAVRPFFDEAPMEKVEGLAKWYEAEFPAGPLPEPNFIFTDVSDAVWSGWKKASELRTLENLIALAQRKGLELTVGGNHPTAKYQLVVNGTPASRSMYYREVATQIEQH